MMRRSFRVGLRVGLLGGIAAAIAKAVQGRRSSSPAVEEPAAWPPIQQEPPSPPEPEVPSVQAEVDTSPPVKKAAKNAPAAKKAAPAKKAAAAKAPAAKKTATPAGGAAWVEATGSVCPPSHPVKAKLTSRLYHLPGMFAYARTVPDRCYGSPEQAEADGLRRAKR